MEVSLARNCLGAEVKEQPTLLAAMGGGDLAVAEPVEDVAAEEHPPLQLPLALQDLRDHFTGIAHDAAGPLPLEHRIGPGVVLHEGKLVRTPEATLLATAPTHLGAQPEEQTVDEPAPQRQPAGLPGLQVGVVAKAVDKEGGDQCGGRVDVAVGGCAEVRGQRLVVTPHHVFTRITEPTAACLGSGTLGQALAEPCLLGGREPGVGLHVNKEPVPPLRDAGMREFYRAGGAADTRVRSARARSPVAEDIGEVGAVDEPVAVDVRPGLAAGAAPGAQHGGEVDAVDRAVA